MSDMTNDPLWPVFKPLWIDLKKAGGASIIIAGGYGLFLKQNWLLAHQSVPIIVPVAQWRNAMPRVTKDFDLVIGLDLLAKEEAQENLLAALTAHEFKVTQNNPRWQFEKSLPQNRTVLVELHAQLPPVDHSTLESDRIRVKRKPSLHGKGIHGRTNPEAIGCDQAPFPFEVDGCAVSVANPITWCIMKLTAMLDHHGRSIEEERSQADRAYCRDQAIKHARDVCRIAAMVTREESDALPAVINSIRLIPQFSKAGIICSDFFQSDEGRGVLAAGGDWDPADLLVIRQTLARWFIEPVNLV